MLHGAFAAALLLTAFALKEKSPDEPTKIFELVAGGGDNWAATKAPALGTPAGVKFEPSAQPAPQVRPEPVAPPTPEPIRETVPEPSPIVAAPAEPVVAPKAEPKKTPPQKTFAEQVQQTAARKERQIMTKHRRTEAARAKQEAAAEAKRKAAEDAAKKRMSYDEFSKNNPVKTAANTKTASGPAPKISTRGITDGVSGGTTDKPGAGGTALSRAEQDRLGTYFAMLKQRLQAAHEKPLGVSDQLTARVSFHVAANGTISQVRIVKSSGSAEFDRSALDAFKTVGSIGPRPDGRGDTKETDFQMRDTE